MSSFPQSRERFMRLRNECCCWSRFINRNSFIEPLGTAFKDAFGRNQQLVLTSPNRIKPKEAPMFLTCSSSESVWDCRCVAMSGAGPATRTLVGLVEFGCDPCEFHFLFRTLSYGDSCPCVTNSRMNIQWYVAILHTYNIRCCVWNRLCWLGWLALASCHCYCPCDTGESSLISLCLSLTSVSLSLSPHLWLSSCQSQVSGDASEPVSLCLALTFSLSISLYLYIYYTISLSWWSTIFDLNWYIFI